MNFVTVTLLSMGCLLSYNALRTSAFVNKCEKLHSPVGRIEKRVTLRTSSYVFCWTIPVSSGKFIHLKLVDFSTTRDCQRSFVKISSSEETYKFCQDDKANSITMLRNTTVTYEVAGRSYGSFYEIESIDSLHLDYIIRDLECINKRSFSCSNISCIPHFKVCDGVKDCRNGLDEIGCETGVLSISGVVEARNKAVSSLKKLKVTSWGWKDYTPRGVVALYLASDVTFNGKILEEELMAKETETKIAVSLLRPSLTNSELSMFIHALLVTCHNPRDFYGNDLVKRLKEQVQSSKNVSHPISYLALCNARESWPERAESDLGSILNSTLKYPFLKDLQAMAILALSCKANSTGSSNTSFPLEISRLYKNSSESLMNFQVQDGSFGNLHTSALIIQALLSSGQENNKDWNLKASIQYLIKQLNSPSLDFLSVYLMLPILNGKSLIDIYNVNCAISPRKHDDDPVSDVSEFLGPKMRVLYALYIGDEIDVIHAISLRVPENYTAFQIMQLAEVEDHKYKFQWKMMSEKKYVFNISNTSNDPETGKFWLLYVRPKNDTVTLKHFETGPDEVVLKDGEQLIYWFKTASI